MRVLASMTIAAALLLTVSCGNSSDAPTGDAAELSLTAVPAISSWSAINGISVPLGKTDGPRSGSGEPFSGFSHTPQGAALAAIGQSVQLSTASDQSWPKMLAALAVSGEGRDEFAVNRALISSNGDVDPAVAPSILGYVVTSYDDSAAAVDVVQRFPDDSIASTRSAVVWTDTDWKLNLPPSQNSVPATALTEIPAGMVDLEGTRK